ncbi:aldehyde dehydrogenase family protein [Enterococcus xiangfangensis]|uniref:aldehyde dehydrogenase family protein n=1 Tax=Enterococcus xiangfangensis TaxID=1296537 RepID=UPI0010F6305D|nr:aldehyde dehydrogenase family protein [Enterococcus xiangfangensis]MBM7712338.1 acyl-CoA reductase-like NAD-dependent aldehyde dehydrogenase [Enterococcus xiangfangensis]NBK08815.1 aldehyde dehydrogenase family protein [Enterococcus asini]
MQFVDKDLKSIQEARILVESARDAQSLLKEYDQTTIDRMINEIINEVKKELPELVTFEMTETNKGKKEDKLFLWEKFLAELTDSLNEKVIGILDGENTKEFKKIGVPLGVIVVILPAENVLLNALFVSLSALKAGNTIIFVPQPKTEQLVFKLVEVIQRTNPGFPKTSISWMENTTVEGVEALIDQKAVALVINIDTPAYFDLKTSQKPSIYGGIGSTPVFVERSANIVEAAQNIIKSRSFDNGLLPAAEQFVIAESVIVQELKAAMINAGAYFMSAEEEGKLLKQLFLGTEVNPAIIGENAKTLAKLAGFNVPTETKVLVSEQPYIFDENPFTTALKCPILTFYLEADWIHACDKCIQLLKEKQNGHTLAIHSNNPTVIKEFALKKPVGRMIVNAGAGFAGIGLDSDLPVSLILGGITTNRGFTAKNITAKDLTYERAISFGKAVKETVTKKMGVSEEQVLFEKILKKLMEQ